MPRKLKIEKQSDPGNKTTPGPDLVIDRDVFLAALEKVKQVVRAKSILPILNNVLIEFAPGLITVTATDLELTVVVTIAGGFELSESRAYLLPGELLRNALSKMKAGDVVVSFPGDDPVTLIQDTYEIAFPEILKDDFPEVALETGEQILTIEGKRLATAINKVIYAVSKDEARYALMGVALMISDEELFTVGTDGFRISVYKSPADAASTLPATIIPRRAAKLAADLLDIDGIVQARLGRNDKAEITTLTFDAPNLLIRTRVINQAYPDWRQLLSFDVAESDARLCTISTSYMLECLERIGIVSGADAARMVIAPGRVDFEAESGLAKTKSWIPATVNFPGTEYRVVVGQLADAFGHIGTDRADMVTPETYGIITITEKPEKDGPARHIQGIMPWRV